MRAVVQRVSRAKVSVNGEVAGEIGRGLLVLLGVGAGDARSDADYLAEKIVGLRIFEDAGGKMNLAVDEIEGAVLVVSQFTLYGDVRRGRGHHSTARLLLTWRGSFTNILSGRFVRLAYAARLGVFRRRCRSSW